MHDDELTAAEREAFAKLPREATPDPGLEERVVAELRVRGLLRGAGVRAIESARRWPRAILAPATIAASLALFASGVAVGQWLSTRQAMNTLAREEHDHAARAAEAGSAYVAALAALANAQRADPSAGISTEQEQAVDVFLAAANEIVKMAPNSPVASQVLKGLDRAQQEKGTSGDDARRVVWF